MTAHTTPWHHWPVALLTLLFYIAAAVDYVLARFGVWADRHPEEWAAYVAGLPTWLDAIWSVTVWGGLLGAYLLWRRTRHAVLLLFLGAAGLIFMAVWMGFFTRPTIISVIGFNGFYAFVGSAALALLFYLYARWERTELTLA